LLAMLNKTFSVIFKHRENNPIQISAT